MEDQSGNTGISPVLKDHFGCPGGFFDIYRVDTRGMDFDQDVGGAFHGQRGNFAQLILIGRSMLWNIDRKHPVYCNSSGSYSIPSETVNLL